MAAQGPAGRCCDGCAAGRLAAAFNDLVAPAERCVLATTRPDTFTRHIALRYARGAVAVALSAAVLAVCSLVHRFAVLFVIFIAVTSCAIWYFWVRLVKVWLPDGVGCGPRANAGQRASKLGPKIAFYAVVLVSFSAFMRPPSMMRPDPNPWIVLAYSTCGLVVIVVAVTWVADWGAMLFACCCRPGYCCEATLDAESLAADIAADAEREAARRRRVSPVTGLPVSPAARRRLDGGRARRAARWKRGGAFAIIMVSACIFVLALVVGFGPIPLVLVEVPLLRLPACMDGLTIGVVADLHVGVCAGTRDVERFVEQMNDADPDIVALVGDITEGKPAQLAAALAPLRKLKALARRAVFFVPGNHEYIGGDPEGWKRLYARDLGVRVLNDTYVDLRASSLVDGGGAARFPGCAANGTAGAAGFDLAGVNDFNFAPADVAAVFAGRDRARELVLLAHQPKQILEAREAGAGLMISGHVHGGQIFPMHFATYMAGYGPAFAGLHRFTNYGNHPGEPNHSEGDAMVTWVYTSEGAVGWGPRVRFLSSPENTVVTLRAVGVGPNGRPGAEYTGPLERRMGDLVATISVWMVALTCVTVAYADWLKSKRDFKRAQKKKKEEGGGGGGGGGEDAGDYGDGERPPAGRDGTTREGAAAAVSRDYDRPNAIAFLGGLDRLEAARGRRPPPGVPEESKLEPIHVGDGGAIEVV